MRYPHDFHAAERTPTVENGDPLCGELSPQLSRRVKVNRVTLSARRAVDAHLLDSCVHNRHSLAGSRTAVANHTDRNDAKAIRQRLQVRGIQPLLAQRNTKHGSGLGRWRWVVERTFAWLNQFRRLRVRYEKRVDIHEAFLALGCILICWKFLDGWEPAARTWQFALI